MYMWNMKALSLMVRKQWSRLTFFESRSNFKLKVSRLNNLVPMERSCHKVKVKSSICSSLWVIDKVKVFYACQCPHRHWGYNKSSLDICPCELKITWFVIMYTCHYDRISAIARLVRFVLKRHAPGATNSNFLSLALTFDLLTQNE